jgi:uncharacterized repeat protein (TIGR01451 family)
VVAGGGTILIAKNLGVVSGTVAFAEAGIFSDPDYAFYHVAVADLTGDGYDDIVATARPLGSYTGKLAVFINKGANGTGFNDPVYYDAGTPYLYNIATGDLNGDGMPDVAVSGYIQKSGTGAYADYIFTFMNQGDGTMGPVTQYPMRSNVADVEIANVAGHADGRSDIMAPGAEFYIFNGKTAIYDQTTLEVLVNRGDDTFFDSPAFFAGRAEPITGQPALTPGGAAVLDDNTGGGANVLVASHVDGGVTQLGFAAGTDSGGYFSSLKVSSALTASYKTAPQSSRVAVADLNGDGRPDIVTAVDPAPGGAALSGSISASALLNTATSAPFAVLRVSAESNAVNRRATPGQEILYTISYVNNGIGAAEDVSLGATLSALGAYVNGSASDGGTSSVAHGLTLLKWTLGTLPAKSRGSVTFKATINAAAKLGKPLSGVVAIAEGKQLKDRGRLPVITTESPLQLRLAVAPDSNPAGTGTTARGDTLTYTLNYENLGPDAAQNVVLMSNLPTGTALALVDNQPEDSGAKIITKGSSETLQWSRGTVSAGGSGSETFVVTVDANAKLKSHLNATARISATGLAPVVHSFPPLLVTGP